MTWNQNQKSLLWKWL